MATGRLFTPEEAESNFGEVGKSASIPADKFKEGLKKCNSKVMFDIVKDKPVMTDDDRNVLHPDDHPAVEPDHPLHCYSKDVANQLMEQQDQQQNVELQQRRHAFTVQSGEKVMELSSLCPPFCE